MGDLHTTAHIDGGIGVGNDAAAGEREGIFIFEIPNAVDPGKGLERGIAPFNFRSEFRNKFQRERYRNAMDEVRAVLHPHVTGGVYVNYPYPGLENWAEAYWGATLPRRREIKRKWDPDNLFRHAQSVPVA